MLNKRNFYISVVDEGLLERFSVLDIDMNLEVPIFCIPEILDSDWFKYVKLIKSMLEPKGLICGMHGPFNSIAYHSRDPLVRRVAGYRMCQGLEIASALGARFIVYHSTYSQFVAEKDYWKRWPEQAMRGLPDIVKEAEERQILIVLENIWDDGPGALKGLLERLDSEYLKICIDIGHLNLFSKMPLRAWFDTLSEKIGHFHLHNNFGVLDDHNALDDGTFDFEGFFRLVSEYNMDATFTLEVGRLESVNPSIEYLKGLGLVEGF